MTPRSFAYSCETRRPLQRSARSDRPDKLIQELLELFERSPGPFTHGIVRPGPLRLDGRGEVGREEERRLSADHEPRLQHLRSSKDMPFWRVRAASETVIRCCRSVLGRDATDLVAVLTDARNSKHRSCARPRDPGDSRRSRTRPLDALPVVRGRVGVGDSYDGDFRRSLLVMAKSGGSESVPMDAQPSTYRPLVVHSGRRFGWWVEGRKSNGRRYMWTWWPTKGIASLVAELGLRYSDVWAEPRCRSRSKRRRANADNRRHWYSLLAFMAGVSDRHQGRSCCWRPVGCRRRARGRRLTRVVGGARNSEQLVAALVTRVCSLGEQLAGTPS